MSKTVHFSLRLEKTLKAALDRFAEEDNRSVGNLMETALKQYVQQRQGAQDHSRHTGRK